jgi:hypothetical protein
LKLVTKNRAFMSPSPEIALVTVLPEVLLRGPDRRPWDRSRSLTPGSAPPRP